MMEAADHGRLDDATPVGRFHRSWLWWILVQGGVCSGVVVIEEVVTEQAAQMILVEDEEVIEALPAHGPDKAFHVGILPRRPRGARHLVDPQRVHAA
jgi:hypothetical protein